MAAPVVLVAATPRRASDAAAVPVLLAGGGGVVPYFYAGQHYRAGIVGLPKSVASLDFDGEQLGGGGVAQALELRWAPATNAALAELSGHFWNDAPITVRVGPEGAALPPIAMSGLVLDAAGDAGSLRIALSDQTADLKRPLLIDRYAGTGGIEGPIEWEGQIKSRAWGRNFNVPGRMLVPASNILCFGDPRRPWQAFVQVRNRGVAIETLTVLAWQGSAEATLAALVAVAVPDGTAVACPSIACVKWWTDPAGDIHADIRGETDGGYVETAPAIAARIAASRSALTVEANELAATIAARPGPFGWRVDTEGATAAGELSELLAGVSLSWLIVAGRIAFRRWEWTAPTRVARSHGVNRRTVYKPVTARKLGYRRNWSPMARGDLAGIVLAREVVYEDGTLDAYLAGLTQDIGRIVSDAWLSKGEKPLAIIQWAALTREVDALRAQYVALGSPADVTAVIDAATLRRDELKTYLDGLVPAWNDTDTDTPIEPATYLQKWIEAGTALASARPAITGRKGEPGLNGTDGLPGVRGADGRTSYVHYAYANSPDGTIDFTVDAPASRAYEGSYTDFTVADSNDPAAYVWREYKGPPFGMAARGAVIAGANIIKRLDGTNEWNADAYSTIGFRNGVVATFQFPDVGQMMAGLNTDPTADTSYGSLDFAWYREGNGARIFESGEDRGLMFTGIGATYTFRVEYDGRFIKYYVDEQGPYRIVDVGAGKLYYFDSSIVTAGARIANVGFIARGSNGTDGRDGVNGNNGAPGRDGINGGSAFFHVAYADSADGAANFTTGAPGARTYLGVAVDQNAADPENYAVYSWSLIKGRDGLNGNDGTPGARGADGRQSYVHFAYSNSADGSAAFSTDDPTGRAYIGVYSDFTLADSGDYRVYSWSLAKGADGANGANGANGAPGANGANGANGKDGFGLIASPATFIIPSTSGGGSKPVWQGGSCRLALIKGGVEVAADAYSVVAIANVSSVALSGRNVNFADVVGDQGEFTGRATLAGVNYDMRVPVTRARDGSAAFQSSQPFSANAASATGSGNTTTPGGRTATISASASYLAQAGRNCTGTLAIYWRNLTDGGPSNFLGSVTGSLSSNRNLGSPTEPEYEGIYGSVSASFNFTTPSPDKLIEYFAGFTTSSNGGGYVQGVVQLQVTA